MFHSLTHLAVMTALLAAWPVSANPMQPTGKWNLEYTATGCVAKRTYGDYVLAFEPAALGSTTTYIVIGPGRTGYYAEQHKALIHLSDGKPPIETTGLIYPFGKDRRTLRIVLHPAESERVASSNQLRISAGDKVHRSRDFSRIPEDEVRMSADFWVGWSSALSKALATCMDDLRKHWGVVDGKLPEPAVRAKARRDVRLLFKPKDFPADALRNNQSGTAQFTLMIDESGDVLDCVVSKSSGIASMDAMGCIVFRERAKFEPARDADGKPMKDVYVTPPVRWQIG